GIWVFQADGESDAYGGNKGGDGKKNKKRNTYEAEPAPTMSAAQLDAAANTEKTRLAKVAEEAARKVRMCLQEVEQKRTKANKMREQLEEATDALFTATAAQEKAETERNDADRILREFNPEQWKLLLSREEPLLPAAFLLPVARHGAPSGGLLAVLLMLALLRDLLRDR
ncbi:unnamed protein product, partial [Prorocentrum cordatum]